MHPTDADLRAMIDGEVPAERIAALTRHLADCATCAAQHHALGHEVSVVSGLIDLVDPPPFVLDHGAVMRHAVAVRGRRRPALIAGGLTLLAIAAAATVAGTRLVRVVQSRRPAAERSSRDESLPASPQPPKQAAVSIVPGRDVTIALAAAQQSGMLSITFASDSELVLRSTAPVGYRVYAGGIAVSNGNSNASYDLTVPTGGWHFTVRVAGRVVFERLPDGAVRAPVSVGPGGRYEIPVR